MYTTHVPPSLKCSNSDLSFLVGLSEQLKQTIPQFTVKVEHTSKCSSEANSIVAA